MMKNNRGSLTIIAIFTILIFSLYGILLYARSASAYIRQSKSIETIQAIYAQDVPNAARIAEQLGATSTYVGEYYTITINPDNGSEITSISLMPGELVSRPTTPLKEGKGFENWYYINASGVEEVFDFSVAPTSDVDIYAKYTGEAIMMARSDVSFWKDEYRTKITSIRFIIGEIPTDIDMLDDVQISGAARIGAYIEGDGEGGYSLTVVSPNTIYANNNMINYFREFNKLKTIEFNNFNTNKTTNMTSLFRSCNSLQEVNLNNFNTSKVTRMEQMFIWCSSLKNLDLSNFNTNNVNSMLEMFYGCSSLERLNLSRFNTNNVKNMKSMFFGCSSLIDIDLSNFNTSGVTNMSHMFRGCINLKTIYASDKYKTNLVTDSTSMFSNCNSLIGGNNTIYSSDFVDATYARIDTAETPGYFTLKTN